MEQTDKELLEKSDMMWANIEEKVKLSLEEIEEQRKKTFKKFLKDGSQYGAIFAVMTYIITVLVEYVYSYHFGAALLFAIIALVASFAVVYYNEQSNMKGLYYSKIMSPFLEDLFKSAEKEGTKKKGITSLTEAPFNNAGNSVLFNAKPNKVSTSLDDSIIGKTENNRFYFGEVKYTNQYNNSWFDRWFKDSLLFQGLIFFADFHKEFPGRVLVCTKRKWRTLNQDKNFKTVAMEDVKFNKVFTVRTLNEQEAYYILSTSLIERIYNLHQHIKKNMHEKHMIMHFERKRVYILIPSIRDRFEPGVFTRLKLESVKNDFYTLQIMLSIVEELNLNTRIWTKE